MNKERSPLEGVEGEARFWRWTHRTMLDFFELVDRLETGEAILHQKIGKYYWISNESLEARFRQSANPDLVWASRYKKNVHYITTLSKTEYTRAFEFLMHALPEEIENPSAFFFIGDHILDRRFACNKYGDYVYLSEIPLEIVGTAERLARQNGLAVDIHPEDIFIAEERDLPPIAEDHIKLFKKHKKVISNP